MANYHTGETIICSVEVKNSGGTLTDPATSMKITIIGTFAVVDNVSMVKDSTGKYHYDFDSTGKQVGVYNAEFIATDGSRISKQRDSFNLI